MAAYDIITIGGGLGGAALARSMAERGARVLVLERETKFKDRVRGEGMVPWGSVEAKKLGIYDLLLSSCGHELLWWDNFAGPMQMAHRELVSTTPGASVSLAFYHPEMQETLLAAAEKAGAEVRRGVRAKSVTPGKEPSVTVEGAGGKSETLSAKLVVGADGRGSLVRKWGGFSEQRDQGRLLLCGLFMENSKAPEDTVRLVSDFGNGRASIIFPLGKKRVRTYFAYGVGEEMRLQGDKDVPKYIEACIATGMPAEYFEGAEAAGPLASFEGADCWVDHPYKNGVTLVGDAAAWTDPSWGQGLSLTLRDVRVLRDALLANDDWDAAGNAYAAEHDSYYEIIHKVEDWMTTFFYDNSPEGEARRNRALPLIAQDPMRIPDHIMTGPDQPADETVRRRFFGEE